MDTRDLVKGKSDEQPPQINIQPNNNLSTEPININTESIALESKLPSLQNNNLTASSCRTTCSIRELAKVNQLFMVPFLIDNRMPQDTPGEDKI